MLIYLLIGGIISSAPNLLVLPQRTESTTEYTIIVKKDKEISFPSKKVFPQFVTQVFQESLL